MSSPSSSSCSFSWQCCCSIVFSPNRSSLEIPRTCIIDFPGPSDCIGSELRLKAAMPPLLQKFVGVHPWYRRRCHGRTIHQPSRLWPSRHPGEFDPDRLSQPAQSNSENVVEPEQAMSSPALRKTGIVVHPCRNNRHWGIPSLEEWTDQIGCSGSKRCLEWPGHTRSHLGPQCWQADRSRQLQP
jgi:hypothetical protein